MKFTTPERNTLFAALKALLTSDDQARGLVALSSGLGKVEDIAALIERIERDGQQ